MTFVHFLKLTFMSMVVNAIDSLSHTNQPCFIFGPYRRGSYRLGSHLFDLLFSFGKHSSPRELSVSMSLSEVF